MNREARSGGAPCQAQAALSFPDELAARLPSRYEDARVARQRLILPHSSCHSKGLEM